jgi:pyridoxamine 5'-phosphate oxidase
MERNLADLRRDYSGQELSKDSVAKDPFVQFANWFDEYLNVAPPEPNAMTISTIGRDDLPSSRVVLLKGFDERGFVFFTNYESKKARDIMANPQVALHFFWPELERQVEIGGRAEQTSREESEAYFVTRPVASKIGAWASKQSEPLESRSELEARVEELRAHFGSDDIPCPPFWGGFRISPSKFEFWQGRRSRLHDRITYEPYEFGWKIVRLSP